MAKAIELITKMNVDHVSLTERGLELGGQILQSNHLRPNQCDNSIVEKLTMAVEVLYYGSPELQDVAENAFSGCASTQRNSQHELREFLEKNG